MNQLKNILRYVQLNNNNILKLITNTLILRSLTNIENISFNWNFLFGIFSFCIEKNKVNIDISMLNQSMFTLFYLHYYFFSLLNI